MGHITAKNKIIILTLTWFLLSGLCLTYFFKFLDNSNTAVLASMGTDLTNLATLRAQNESYKQAQKDLEQLKTKSLQPEDLFSKDVTLVKEIEELESLQQKYNVKIQLGGISGTVNSLSKAKTSSALANIPYSISLNGNFTDVVNAIENLENLSFITNIGAVTMSAADKGSVTANLTANFYLRK